MRIPRCAGSTPVAQSGPPVVAAGGRTRELELRTEPQALLDRRGSGNESWENQI